MRKNKLKLKVTIPQGVKTKAKKDSAVVAKYTYYRDYKQEMQNEFESIKKAMIDEFIWHPITQEIYGGMRDINFPNISNTLNGVTNLYSFIGFEKGTDPIAPILQLFELYTKINFYPVNKFFISFQIEIPSSKDVFKPNVSAMPWPGFNRSWAQGIELGISGLIYYIKKQKNSRSGLGVQSKKKVRKKYSKFKNTKYISDLLRRYKKEFEQIGKSRRIINSSSKPTDDFYGMLTNKYD